MEQVALDSSLIELYFGILTVQNGSAELPVALLLYVLNLHRYPRTSDRGMQKCTPE